MFWNYAHILDKVRATAEREGNTLILNTSREEQIEILKEIQKDYLVLQEKKKEEEKKKRCEVTCQALKTMIDSFCATDKPHRAVSIIIDSCDTCLFTCAVEYNMPLCFYIELLEVDGIKIVIDSLINSIVGEVDDELIIEIELSEVYMEKLTSHIISLADKMRQTQEMKVVNRYKDVEYTVNLKK